METRGEIRLGLVILAVRDVARSAGFYRAAFGWAQTVDVPVYAEFALPGGMRVGVYERRSFGQNAGEVPGELPEGVLAPTELYLYAQDLQAAMASVMSAGARCLSPLAARAWGDEAAYFADPDGNVVVLARRLA